jgi:SAM-dependent methyltransferase
MACSLPRRTRVAAAVFQAPGDLYDRFIGRYGPALGDAMLGFAEVRSGMRVLDVGCGSGALAGRAAAVVGGGHVAAVDPSEPFVEACRRRVPEADVRVASAESLPFDDGSFDAVLSQLVVNFMSDARTGVLEMARVAKPGGAVAACVWDYADGMRMLRAFWDSAKITDPAAPDEGAFMRYASPGELEALWKDAGLESVETAPLDAEASYDDFDDLWSSFLAGIGPAGSYAVSLDEKPRSALRDRFRTALGDPAGPFTLTARAWGVRGTT